MIQQHTFKRFEWATSLNPVDPNCPPAPSPPANVLPVGRNLELLDDPCDDERPAVVTHAEADHKVRPMVPSTTSRYLRRERKTTCKYTYKHTLLIFIIPVCVHISTNRMEEDILDMNDDEILVRETPHTIFLEASLIERLGIRQSSQRTEAANSNE